MVEKQLFPGKNCIVGNGVMRGLDIVVDTGPVQNVEISVKKSFCVADCRMKILTSTSEKYWDVTSMPHNGRWP